MAPNQQQQTFLSNRRRLLDAWRWVGPVCILLIVGFGLWLATTNPLLVNPVETASRLEHDRLDKATLSLMAMMLPIMFLACLGLLVALIVVMYAAFSNEKKYLEIIAALTSSAATTN